MKRWDRWRDGLLIGVGLAAGSFAMALTFGATAVHAGLPAFAVVVMSLVTFSGSAQFAFVTALASGGGLVPALGSASLINLRFVPIAAACSQALRGGPWRRAVEAQAVVDGSWAAAQQPDGSVKRDTLIPATLVQWPAWVTGTAIGAYAAPPTTIFYRLGLDVIFPAFFAVLLVDVIRQRPDLRIAMACSGLLTALMLWFLPAGPALLVGATPALLTVRTGRSA